VQIKLRNSIFWYLEFHTGLFPTFESSKNLNAMKRICVLLFLLGVVFQADAGIWRVNNNPSMGANYASINDAINSPVVNNFDTLHIEPSGTNYNAFTLTKRLVLIGVGYLLQQNTGYQATAQWVKVSGTSYCNSGSAGSVIQGLDFSVGSGLYINVPNTVVTRCCFQSSTLSLSSDANGTMYLSNWGGSISLTSATNLQGISLRNSFLWSFSTSSSNTVLMENCYLYSTSAYSTSTGVYKNNIFPSGTPSITSGTSAIFSNNIFHGSPFNSGGIQGSNLVNIAHSQLFTSSSFDYNIQSTLTPLGNALSNAAGENGVDIGIFGGSTPYKVSGIPAVPSIYLLNAPGASSGSLPVTIGIRSND
jgi:hypothetical protein